MVSPDNPRFKVVEDGDLDFLVVDHSAGEEPSGEQMSEAQEVVKALQVALNIAKNNDLTYEQALGVCAKLLQPVPPNFKEIVS